MRLADDGQHLEAVHRRHLDVQKNEVEVLPGEGLEGLGAAGDSGDLISSAPQLAREQIAQHAGVINDQEGKSGRGHELISLLFRNALAFRFAPRQVSYGGRILGLGPSPTAPEVLWPG